MCDFVGNDAAQIPAVVRLARVKNQIGGNIAFIDSDILDAGKRSGEGFGLVRTLEKIKAEAVAEKNLFFDIRVVKRRFFQTLVRRIQNARHAFIHRLARVNLVIFVRNFVGEKILRKDKR